MTVESTTQALCDLALRFGEGDEESMVSCLPLLYLILLSCSFLVCSVLIHFKFFTVSYHKLNFIIYDLDAYSVQSLVQCIFLLGFCLFC